MPKRKEIYLSELDVELEPLIRDLCVLAGTSTGYKIMKENANEFGERMGKAAELAVIIGQTEEETSKVSDPKTKSLMKMFQYLGYVESFGVSIIDTLALLLIASGCQLHVERLRSWPRIIHVSSLEELEHANLASKLGFLKSNKLENVVNFINKNDRMRDLRNDIAHLNFEIDENGKISTKHKKDLDISKELVTLKVYIMYVYESLKTYGLLKWLRRIRA